MRFHCEDCPGRLNRSRLSRFLNFYFLQQKAVTEAGPEGEGKERRGCGIWRKRVDTEDAKSVERRNGCAHCAAVSEANLNFVPLLPLIGDPSSYSTSTIRHSFIHRSAIATFTIHSSTVPNFAVHIHAVLKSIILSSGVPILADSEDTGDSRTLCKSRCGMCLSEL
jgi:hypothetical protein